MADGEPKKRGWQKGESGNPGNRWPKGVSGNPSGRPKKLVEIEAMLDAEHRTVDNMRDVYARLRELAKGEPINIHNTKGEVIRVELRAHPGFMELYLNRVQGPIHQLKADLSEAPPEVIEWIVDHVN